MNILHLLSQTQLTGAEVYAVTLAYEQKKAGHRVYQISNGFYTETTAEKHCLDVEVKTRAAFKINSEWIKNFILSNNIHVVHSHSRAAAKMAHHATKGLKTGHVSTIHGYQHPSWSKRLFNHYGHFQIAVCEEVRTQLIKRFRYNPNRIKVVPNAIELKRFYFLNKISDVSKIKVINVAIIGRTNGPKKTRTEIILKELDLLAQEKKLQIHWTLIGGKISDIDPKVKELLTIQEKHIDYLSSTDLKDYDLIVGSGRVTMESLISGVPTLAFGEACYEGLIKPKNFSNAIISNFGDIKHLQTSLALDPEKLKADFNHFLDGKLSLEQLSSLSKRAAEYFSSSEVYKEVQKIYECAVLLSIHNKWIPVLMYHKIPHQDIKSKHRIYVTKSNFAEHLLFFQKNKFTTIDFQDLKDFSMGLRNPNEFPKKPLILTFDDGYTDNLENADPLMKQLGIKATIFLLADKKIEYNQWDTDGSSEMNAHSAEPKSLILAGLDRQRWLKSVFTIGSHGFNHKKITQMNPAEVFYELQQSKVALEKEFQRNINVFAYTYGATTREAAKLAQMAGYDFAVNTDTGGFLIQEDPYQVFRVNIFPKDTTFTLRKKTSSWYRKYYWFKRKK